MQHKKLHMSLGPTVAGSGPLGGILLQHHASLRSMNQPMVVASPLKVPVSQLPYTVKHHLSLGEGGVVAKSPAGRVAVPEGSGGEGMGGEGVGEGAGKREYQPPGTGGAQPPKRIRLTRKSAGLGSNED